MILELVIEKVEGFFSILNQFWQTVFETKENNAELFIIK